jgi:hypothetical protein
MSDDEYEAALDDLRREWGRVHVDPARPGMLVAENDPFTGLLVGMRAKLFAEIINRALSANPQEKLD